MRLTNPYQRLFLGIVIVGVSMRTIWPNQPITNMVIGCLFLLLFAPFLANKMMYDRRFRKRY